MSAGAATPPRWKAIEWLLGGVAALLLVGLALLTCVDVVGRYFLNRPLTGAFELTELAMGALVFSSLPLVTLHRQQVTVDLFASLVPRAWRRAQNALIDVSAAACIGVIAWQLGRRAVNMAAAGETTATLQIPVYPLVGYMALLAGATVVLMLAMAWTDATDAPPR
ncbi:MAG: TRAP transporter small permease [Rubrivivax sp.]